MCDDLLDTNIKLEHQRDDLQCTVDGNIAILSNQNKDLQILLDGYRRQTKDLLDVETNPNLQRYKKQVESLVTELTLCKTRLQDFDKLVGTNVSFGCALQNLLSFHFGKFSNLDFFANKLMEQIQDPRFLDSRCLDILYHIAECRAKNDMCPLTDPIAIAKATDEHGYILSHNALDKLRQT
jgi:hypothetical protein